ncbi:ABC transporter permease, partial [Halomonas litopenaei]|nr:ABC transporter permease [Halomonas litopenaei]
MAKKMLIAEKRPDLFRFTMPLTALLAAMFGFVGGNMAAQPMLGALIGALVGCAIAFVAETNLMRRTQVRWGVIAVLAIAGLVFGNVGTAVSGAIIGAVLSWTAYWLATGAYGMTVPIYYTPAQTLWHNTFKFICGLIFFFLVAPLIPVMWLSFNAEDFFTFT